MLPTLPALHDAVRAPPMLGDLFDIAGQHFDRFANRGALVLVERGVEFAPGSPLERDGFEPSVPAKSEIDFRASRSTQPSRFPWMDRGSESVSLQRGVSCEPDFLDQGGPFGSLQLRAHPPRQYGHRRCASTRCPMAGSC